MSRCYVRLKRQLAHRIRCCGRYWFQTVRQRRWFARQRSYRMTARMNCSAQRHPMHQTDTPDIYIEAVPEDEPGSSRRLVGNQLEPAQVDALVEQLQKELGRTKARVPINQGGPEAVLARLVQDAGRRKRAPFVLAGLFLAEFAALISLYLICAMRGIRMTGIDVIMCIFL